MAQVIKKATRESFGMALCEDVYKRQGYSRCGCNRKSSSYNELERRHNR